MEEKIIRKYAKLMGELGLTGLEITENGATVRLEKAGAQVSQQLPVPSVPAAAVPAAPAEDDMGSEFRSPMVGVFYCAPAENAEPFVKVGDTVHKGDVLCIIEAMKLMNEITSDRDGVITQVCVGDSQVVDYGHVLFRIKEAK